MITAVRRLWTGFLIVLVYVPFAGLMSVPLAMAEEHGGQALSGKEHGGKEHGGTTASQAQPAASPAAAASTEAAAQAAEPSPEEIRQAIAQYVQQMTEEEGAFSLDDDTAGTTRELTLVQVHERVGKTGDLYYSCTDMKDAATGETLDLDFDVERYDDALEVVDVRIHKVEGKPRYTYDQDDNRVPAM